MIFAPIGFAAGKLDPTFPGHGSETLTQPNGKSLAFGSFQRANGAVEVAALRAHNKMRA